MPIEVSGTRAATQLARDGARIAARVAALCAAAFFLAATTFVAVPLALLLSPLYVPPLLTVVLLSDALVRLLDLLPLYRRASSRLHARVYALTEPRLAERKRALFQDLSGVVVEFGAAEGLNFRLLPAAVREVTIVEPHHALTRAAAAAAAARAAGVQLKTVTGSAERLPLYDESADAVIMTWQLCSVRRPEAALREAARVLKPGGRLVFIDHVAASHGLHDVALPVLGWRTPLQLRWPPLPLWAQQRALNAANKLLCGGCDLARDVGGLVAAQCGSERGALFEAAHLTSFCVPGCGWRGLEWLRTPHVAGVAFKPAAPAVPGNAGGALAGETPARAPGTVTRKLRAADKAAGAAA